MVCFQGKEVIEYYINELLEEGVRYIPPWLDLNPDAKSAPLPHSARIEGEEQASSSQQQVRASKAPVILTHLSTALCLHFKLTWGESIV